MSPIRPQPSRSTSLTPTTKPVSVTPAARRRRLLRLVRAYLLLPHAVPVLLVLATTAAFAVLVVGSIPPIAQLARLLLTMLGGQIAIGAVNEVIDAELDAETKPWKPVAAGDIPVPAALALAAAGLVVMIVVGLSFGPLALLLCLLGTSVGLAYDLWFKRSLLSWLPYLIALPLLPLWVKTAFASFDPRLLLLYPLGGLAVVGVHLAQALPDTAGDRAAGVRNLASVLGETRALLACWAATLSAPALAVVLALSFASRPGPVVIASFVAVTLVALDAVLYVNRPHLGVLACFPCVAISTALVGLGWVLAVGG